MEGETCTRPIREPRWASFRCERSISLQLCYNSITAAFSHSSSPCTELPPATPSTRPSGGAAGRPAGEPGVVDLQQMTRPPDREPAINGVVDQVTDAGLDRCLYSRGTGPAVTVERV